MSIKPQHATPADWAWLEGNSTVDRCDAAWSRGLIEVRARIEALEAGATCPHIITGDEGTSYCGLAEQTQDKLDRLIEMDRAAACMVPPANCRQRLQREGKPYPKSGCEACGDMSPLWRQCNAGLEIEAARPTPASSLAEQVAAKQESVPVFGAYNKTNDQEVIHPLEQKDEKYHLSAVPAPAGSLVERVAGGLSAHDAARLLRDQIATTPTP